MKLLRVLVVDDSPVGRDRIIQTVNRVRAAQVVATADNGADALRRVREHSPDVVTLDLEMPEMDGFSFLRVLMAMHPLPVVVVSSDTRHDSVMRALELGAFDFVAKSEGDSLHFERALAQKIDLARTARIAGIPVATSPAQATPKPSSLAVRDRTPRYVVALAASTGGPAALLDLFTRLEGLSGFAFVIAQHMPPRFTTTFAERLNRQGSVDVAEAKDGDVLRAGEALLCPGDHCMELEQSKDRTLRVSVTRPAAEDRYVPNASRLLASAGQALGVRSIGVVLTGMGDDGAKGASVIASRGGKVFVESQASAVIYGMPEATTWAVPSAVPVTMRELAKELDRLGKRLPKS